MFSSLETVKWRNNQSFKADVEIFHTRWRFSKWLSAFEPQELSGHSTSHLYKFYVLGGSSNGTR